VKVEHYCIACRNAPNERRLITEFMGSAPSKSGSVTVCVGGDGTLLQAEREKPGKPKLFIRDSRTCQGCAFNCKTFKKPRACIRAWGRKAVYCKGSLAACLAGLKKGFRVHEEKKLEARAGGKRLTALNEVNVHWGNPPQALRFDLEVNGRKIVKEAVGDGVVIATPYGSTGYYRAVTRSRLKKGMGVAFKNTQKKLRPLHLRDNAVIKLTVRRNEAVAWADNNPELLRLREGDSITVRKSKRKARMVVL